MVSVTSICLVAGMFVGMFVMYILLEFHREATLLQYKKNTKESRDSETFVVCSHKKLSISTLGKLYTCESCGKSFYF